MKTLMASLRQDTVRNIGTRTSTVRLGPTCVRRGRRSASKEGSDTADSLRDCNDEL